MRPNSKKILTRESSGGHQARKRKKGRKNLSPNEAEFEIYEKGRSDGIH
jgi:hypothetical protein